MKKSVRMEAFIDGLARDGNAGSPERENEEAFDHCYLGYFKCFNEGRYYEAHDVLEHLWLKGGRGCSNHAFYKGLIQLAGAFVHLKLQHLHPQHPKHGRRLEPARRLFLLASGNLEAYGPRHLGIDVPDFVHLARSFAILIEEGGGDLNPWDLAALPRIAFPKGC